MYSNLGQRLFECEAIKVLNETSQTDIPISKNENGLY